MITKKLIFFQCLLLLLNTGLAQSYSQDRSLEGRTLVYGQDVHLNHPIQIDPDDPRPLNQILDESLKGTGITYRITRNHILLFAPSEDNKPKNISHTLYGYVIDQESKENLIGANVYVPIYLKGTSSNEFGYFSITLPEGESLIETSYIGYQKDSRILNLTKDTLITIPLRLNHSLGEVVIQSDRPDTGSHSSRLGAMTIPVQQIQNTPTLLGEADVIKSLQLLPGVQPTFSGQSNISVRGGDADQNLFLLDGMMLYNVEHTMGFESAFMPDAVKHVDFYRSSFPARYGGRLSSVTDVRTKDGDMQHYHGLFSIGLLSSHLSFEAPLVKDRTALIVSARRSYADWLINAMKNPLEISLDRLGLFFYDFNAKVNHKFGDKDRLYLSLYRGRDEIRARDRQTNEYQSYKSTDLTTIDLHWGNTLYNLRWNHLFSPNLFANLSVGYNRFQLSNFFELNNREYKSGDLYSEQLSNMRYKSGIDDMTANLDFDYHPHLGHHIQFGAQYTLHQFHPEVQSSQVKTFVSDNVSTDEFFKNNNQSISGYEFALYAEDDMNIGTRWQMNAGLRASVFTTQGKSFPALEPRISLCHMMDSDWRAKLSYSLMHQYVHKITSSQIASPSDLWGPVTKNMKPMTAHQWATGMSYDGLPGWEFDADAYLKEMYNVIDVIDGANFYGNSKAWETKVTSGRGRAYGIELSAQKTTGRITGMLNYTLAKTDRWFPNGLVNSGRKYPYRYDRRHVVHFFMRYQLSHNIDLNASWNFASGALVTVAKQQTAYIEPDGNMFEESYYSGRNNYRMEPTHQLDLGINFHHTTRHGERIWNISLMNAYHHLNQDMIFTSIKTEYEIKGYNPDGMPITERKEKRILKQFTVIPILPSFTYTYKF